MYFHAETETHTLMSIQELLSLFQSGKATAKSHMKNLIEMAAADGNFDQVEYDLLKRIASKNGISESQLKNIRSNPGNIKFELPKDNRERFHQFYDLVHMMSIDNAIHPDEMKLCDLFAVKFGYPKQKSRELIETISSNIKYGQTHDETFKRVIALTL
ncbi:MAG: TerB family tellurite resistance protein [Bacteroidetes bacterium]|nr:TerB family tellurite resistance protein [Bacteroidota bacterium]